MSFSMDTAFVGSWSMHYEREAWLSGVYREDQTGIIGKKFLVRMAAFLSPVYVLDVLLESKLHEPVVFLSIADEREG